MQSDHAAPHAHFMEQALDQARTALRAGEFPVGCVLVLDGEVVARGRRRNSSGGRANEIDHAEVVTLRRLLAERPGVDCGRLVVYSTMEPCLMCYATMLLSGIRSFVYGYEDVMGGATGLALETLTPLYADMRVSVVPGVLRGQCLSLFRSFFQTHDYWAGSLLADYTLARKTGEKNP